MDVSAVNPDLPHALRLAAAALLFAASPAFAAKPHYTLTGKVVAITDGDTLTVLDDAKVQHKIRLAGIDAPERKQAFGARARQALGDMVFGNVVRVDVIDVDRYKREAGRIFLGNRFINMEMVQNGSPGDTLNTIRARSQKATHACTDAACRRIGSRSRPGNSAERCT